MFKLAFFIAAVLLFPYVKGQSLSGHISAKNIVQFSRAEKLFTDPADTISYNGPLTFCAGGNVLLTANNAPAGATFQWQKDGIDIPSATSVSLTVTISGVYSVIVNSIGYASVTVTVNPNPVTGFNFGPNNQCGTTPISFIPNASGNGLSFTWNFNDPNSGSSNSSSSANPLHQFVGNFGNSTQSFTVGLTVTNNSGCSSSSNDIITVKQLPEAHLGGPGSGTYDNKLYFKKCTGASSAQFDFTNLSSTIATNTLYKIVWGDNSADYISSSFNFPASHTYTIGTFTLKFIVSGQNGCTDTATYYIFLGSNPAVGLGNPGNTTICTGSSLTFPISSTTSNPPGTIYTVSFNDGSAPIIYQHPAPQDVTHTFAISSCNTISGGYANSFSATIQASNPCQSSSATVVPIYVSQRSDPAFAISPKDTVCLNTNVTVTNISNGNNYVDNGNCLNGNEIWNISPSTGWSITNGNLGNDFGLSDASSWSPGSNSLTLHFNVPGTYSIKLKTGNPRCGNDSVIKTICVNPNPIAAFNINNNQGCAPFTAMAINNSNLPECGSNLYFWTIAYANNSGCTPNTANFGYVNGTNSNSSNPSIQFNNPGIYTLSLITKTPGEVCSSGSVSQTITIKAKPNVLITAPTEICQNASFQPSASISNCYSVNPTTYLWSFPGAIPISSTSLSPGSINYNSVGLNAMELSVTNECGTSTVSKPITIKPSPDVNVPANVTVCEGSSVGPFVFNGSLNGTTYLWSNSATSIGLIASGSGNILAFNTTNSGNNPIVATISVTPSNNGCTGPVQSFTITVNPKPLSPTVTTPVNYCRGVSSTQLSANGNSGNTFLWYATQNGGSGDPVAPIPSTNVTGSTIYYVSQLNPATGCEGPRASITVNVKPTPVIGNTTAVNPSLCNSTNGSITLSGLSSNTLYTVNYTKNGLPVATSLNANAAGVLTLNSLTSGIYDHITVSLNGCISNAAGPFTLSDPNPPAAPAVTVSGPVCSGSSLSFTASTTSGGNVTYSWTGPNSFSSSLQNPTILNATIAASGNYIVTISVNGCNSTGSVTAVVNPRPSKPAVVRPVLYCLNQTASVLEATPSLGNILTWYDNPGLNNGTAVPVLPNTSLPGNVNFYVTQTNSFGCESDTAIIPVLIYGLVNGNVIGNDQSLCSGSSAATITGLPGLSGGNGIYSYQWQVSTDNGVTWANIPGAIASNFNPGALFTSVKYRRIVNSGPCNNDVSNVVFIDVNGALANVAVGSPQTICSGTAPSLLTGQTPTGGNGTFNFQWQSSPDNSSWSDISGATSQDYQPLTLSATTYFRRKVISGPCSIFSSSVEITVNPIPVMNAITDNIYCNNTQVGILIPVSNPTDNVSFTWTNDNISTGLGSGGTGNIPGFTGLNNSNPKVPITSNIQILPTYTVNGVACTGSSENFSITILPTISLSLIPDTVVCTGTNIPSYLPLHDAGIYPGSSVSYSWAVAGSGISLTNGNGGQIPAFSTINNGTTDLISTISVTPIYSYGSKTCNGLPVSYTVTVKPATADAFAGMDTVLCAATSYTMHAVGAGGTVGVWTQLSGNQVNITDPSSPATSISGLLQGVTYNFEWKVTGFASCPSSRDTVIIKVDSELINIIDTSTQTICLGQTVSVNGYLPTGGNGSYSYQWQSSIDGLSWTDIPGFTSASIIYQPPHTIYLRRRVVSLPCENESHFAHLIVQAPVSNNNISADQGICINTASVPLTGSDPSGADGIFQYQWQKSTDGGTTWINIPGATGQNFDPGILTGSTKFRRNVFSNLCSGPQSSNSNIVTVTVNPDAKALFTTIKDTSCAPFLIDASVIQLQEFTDRNSNYLWYANGNLIGSGNSFPGYTLSGSGDSITIKLVTISSFNCRNDSMEQNFYTYIEPLPSFTMSDTVGCGPLTILFNNTTPDQGLFHYLWDFGNGQTSSLDHPLPVNFLPNPNYGDTTYIVHMSVVSSCDTIVVSDSVRVKSKPRALFTPDVTVGCSPMTVIFNNTSKGLGNSYVWDFGDGSPLISASSAVSVSHVFITAVRDTFYVKLIASNECGLDSLIYAVVVSPNTIHLDFAVNGNQQSGCSPHTIDFINNSAGASSFTWNFGDGNIINTSDNIDTVAHTFSLPGTYTVHLLATNGCSDTSSTETVIIYPKPHAAFTSNTYSACLGDSIHFTNFSDSATSYLWQFGDGQVSAVANPVHTYSSAGSYNVTLVAFHYNNPGSICTDTAIHSVQVVSSLPGWFSATDTVGYCAPFTVGFINTQVPSVSAVWDFGDGTTGSGNTISHTFLQAGIYQVHLSVIAPGGCTYTSIRTIKVLGPAGSWSYTAGFLCNDNAASFQVLASNTDSLLFYFGDGASMTTVNNLVYHNYVNAGIYFPSVILKNNAGCLVQINGPDSIKVEKIRAGFTATNQMDCGITMVNFSDTSHSFFGKSSVHWDFGDGTTGLGVNEVHGYTSSGLYPVRLIVYGNSGCSDTLTKLVSVVVHSVPVASIIGDTIVCSSYPVLFNSSVQVADSLSLYQWSISNGVIDFSPSFYYSFTQPGIYTIRLITGTVYGCYDTITRNIHVNPTPAITASNDMNLCRGNSSPLSVSGGLQYNWSPLQGLTCYTCNDPVASPLLTTPYVVQGSNSFGCSAYDTVVVTVIQPLSLTVSGADSICIGGSTVMQASGASSYSWSPATGLSNAIIPNPTAAPTVTTNYRVVGYDGYNCFTDTAFVLVAVGQYPVVSLGPDLTLPTGTLQPLSSTILNGPVVLWEWMPTQDLSCHDCSLPVALIRKDITYRVKITNDYGCSATDTLNIKVFCDQAQVYIPNAFTPDGDGINDILMVRGKGIVTVKSFRVFNRWGEIVFEKSNFPPNNVGYGWDGKVKGVAGGPDVYVYTAEVICENGTSYTYKGNVSVLK